METLSLREIDMASTVFRMGVSQSGPPIRGKPLDRPCGTLFRRLEMVAVASTFRMVRRGNPRYHWDPTRSGRATAVPHCPDPCGTVYR